MKGLQNLTVEEFARQYDKTQRQRTVSSSASSSASGKRTAGKKPQTRQQSRSLRSLAGSKKTQLAQERGQCKQFESTSSEIFATEAEPEKLVTLQEVAVDAAVHLGATTSTVSSTSILATAALPSSMLQSSLARDASDSKMPRAGHAQLQLPQGMRRLLYQVTFYLASNF